MTTTAAKPQLRLVDGGLEHPIRKAVRLSQVTSWFYDHVTEAGACIPVPGETAAAAQLRCAVNLAAAEHWLDDSDGAEVRWTPGTGDTWTAVLWVPGARGQEDCPVGFRRNVRCAGPLSDTARVVAAGLAYSVRLWE
jgi:hypothetical protein